uniref:Uncharacterized protein n=1 Tax=Sus scrofa TaxID=9823 RepID=A0A4X1UAA5_PIG
MMKSMKHIYLLLEMMIQSSLTILEMMINTMMISKLNSVFSIPSFQDDMAFLKKIAKFLNVDTLLHL